MEDSKQVQRVKIKSIFEGAKYIVPIYQREYAWEETEIECFLDDINDQDGENVYYLGNLIVDKKDKYEVIDGQQRLTTLYLLFVYLKKYLEDKIVLEDSLTFEARKKVNIYFEKYLSGK